MLRGGARRGRRGKVNQQNTNNLDNKNQAVEGTIATRTRRRIAAAAAVEAPVDEKTNIIGAVAAGVAEVRVVEEERVVLDKKEDIRENPMDEYDSGGKSPEKGNAGDDDLPSPLPEKV